MSLPWLFLKVRGEPATRTAGVFTMKRLMSSVTNKDIHTAVFVVLELKREF